MRTLFSFAVVALATSAFAQIPDGYYAWCSFQGTAGQTGVFFQHPRDAGPPIVVTGLNPDLLWVPGGRQGASCIAIRPSDGALVVGERAEQGHSVDLHLMRLRGSDVAYDQLISMGTGGRAGEIPQCAFLPDERIVVAATDLTQGPLALLLTQSYGYEGVGIVDPVGGNVTPVPITNGQALAQGVFNGLTVSADGTMCYIANYVTSQQGEVWSLPLPAGGQATLIATVPAGVSNLGWDGQGNLLIAALNGPPNLWRVDLSTMQMTTVPTTIGPLNAVGLESVTGNLAVVTANAGTPPRSVFWMENDGTEHLLASPNMATISGIDVAPNPRVYGTATQGQCTYVWKTAPNPGGLPLVGNTSFSLTIESSLPVGAYLGAVVVALAPATQPTTIAGVELLFDPASVATTINLSPQQTMTMPLPVPNDPNLVGGRLFLQTLFGEPGGLAASAGLRVTIL